MPKSASEAGTTTTKHFVLVEALQQQQQVPEVNPHLPPQFAGPPAAAQGIMNTNGTRPSISTSTNNTTRNVFEQSNIHGDIDLMKQHHLLKTHDDEHFAVASSLLELNPQHRRRSHPYRTMISSTTTTNPTPRTEDENTGNSLHHKTLHQDSLPIRHGTPAHLAPEKSSRPRYDSNQLSFDPPTAEGDDRPWKRAMMHHLTAPALNIQNDVMDSSSDLRCPPWNPYREMESQFMDRHIPNHATFSSAAYSSSSSSSSSSRAFFYDHYARYRHEQVIDNMVLNNMIRDSMRRNEFHRLNQQPRPSHPYHCYDYLPNNKHCDLPPILTRQNPFHLEAMHHALNQHAAILSSKSHHHAPLDCNRNTVHDCKTPGRTRFEGMRRTGTCFANKEQDDPSSQMSGGGGYKHGIDDNIFKSTETTSVATSSAMSCPVRMPDLSNDVQNHKSQLPTTQTHASHTSSTTASSSLSNTHVKKTKTEWNDDMLKYLFTKESEQESSDLSCLHDSSSTADSNAVPVYRAPFPLGVETDDLHLSDFFQFLRTECCEVFTASINEVKERKKTKHTELHQVGIRCAFCAHVPYEIRALRSSCYPSALSRIYQSVTMMVRDHFSICSYIPADTRERYNQIKQNSQRKGNMKSRSYWVVAAKMIGIVEREDGLFFMSVPPNH